MSEKEDMTTAALLSLQPIFYSLNEWSVSFGHLLKINDQKVLLNAIGTLIRINYYLAENSELDETPAK